MAIASRLEAEAPAGVRFRTGLGRGRYEVVLVWVTTLRGLAGRLQTVQHHIVFDGGIWLIMPRKEVAAKRGLRFTWGEMQATALGIGLVDNKVASIDGEDYGTRFVIRKERRGPPP